jgi:hypothetical protein
MGRPKKFDAATIRQIEDRGLGVISITPKQLMERRWSKQVTISRRSMFRIQSAVRREHDPALPVLTNEQMQARLKFARDVLSLGSDRYGDIVFSDSVHIVFPTGLSLDAWGAIARGYKSPLMFHDGQMNWERYRDVVDSSRMIPDCFALFGRAWTFQFDKERSHGAHPMVSWLKQNGVRLLDSWSTKGRDFSPIEYVWPLLRRAADESAPTTLPEAEAVLRACWASLSQSQCIDPQVASFPALLRAVERAGGGAVPRATARSRLATVEDQPEVLPLMAAAWEVVTGVRVREDGQRMVQIRHEDGPTEEVPWEEVAQNAVLNVLLRDFVSLLHF